MERVQTKGALLGVFLSISLAACVRSPGPTAPDPELESATSAVVGVNEAMPRTTDSLEATASRTAVTGTGSIDWELTPGGTILFFKTASNVSHLPVLHEYVDYDCAYCREYTRGQRPMIVGEYLLTGKIAIERSFAPVTSWGERLTRAALCAAEEGKFRELDDAFLANAPKRERSGARTGLRDRERRMDWDRER
jgi:protein-disulfide isomerase